MNSIWSETSNFRNFEALNGNMKTDVLIIGGGLAGILCAYMLKESGVECVLAEANRICGGITKNTTAKITFQHGMIYHKLIKKIGTEKAQLYLYSQQAACEKYRLLCKNIDCDYELKNSYAYSVDDRAIAEKELNALNRLGAKASFCEKPDIPLKTAGAVCVENQAQFHPLKFAYSLAEKLPIYENTKIIELRNNKAVTERGEISFKKAIVCTHFPFINKYGGYFLKMYQHRSYVLALEDAKPINGMFVDQNDKGLSFRSYGKLLLLGGGAHRTGKKGGSWQELETFAKGVYPQSRVVAKWATQDCMTLDGVPYIGQYSKSTPNIFVATGFNKWGMSSSMVSAMLLADLINEKENLYSSVYTPSRNMLVPQLAINAFEATIGLLTPTVPRCPHLGCALKYNPQEHSWDCPCHGSRFTKNGELIDNPATDDKNSLF